MPTFHHKEMAAGRWFTLTLAEQLGNVYSDVGRAANAEGKNRQSFDEAVDRALELFDLTLLDERWRGPRRWEINRLREVFCDAAFGGVQYKTSLRAVENYLFPYALAARTMVERRDREKR